MVMYTGAANAGTQDFTLQEFEPSFGSKLHASVREAWLESYGPVAKDWAAATFGDDEPKLTGAEVAAKLKESGLKTKISTEDGRYSATQIDALIARQTELAAVRDVRDRTPWDLGSPIRGAAMFGAGIVDPINLATAFVPWTRMLPAAAAIRGAAVTGETFLARTGARAAVGAADAGISTLALEVPYSLSRNDIGDDYGALDSVANIAFGTAFGAGIHAGGGAAGDFARYLRTGSSKPPVPVPVPTDGSPINSEAQGNAKTNASENIKINRDDLRESSDAGFDSLSDPAKDMTREWALGSGRNGSTLSRMRKAAARLWFGDSGSSAEDVSLLQEIYDAGKAFREAIAAKFAGPDGKVTLYRGIRRGGSKEGHPIESYTTDPSVAREFAGADGDVISEKIDPEDIIFDMGDSESEVLVRRRVGNKDKNSIPDIMKKGLDDASILGDEQISMGDDGRVISAASRTAIQRFIESQPEDVRRSLITEDGELTAVGQRRMAAAAFVKNFGYSPNMTRLAGSFHPADQAVTAGLIRSIPVVDSARVVMTPDAYRAADISNDIADAADRLAALREQGISTKDYLSSPESQAADVTPEQLAIMDYIERNQGSPKRIGDMIEDYYNRVSDADVPVTKAAALADAMRTAESQPAPAVETVNSVSPETREAATRASVAQMLDGREVDVDAIVNMDESIGTSSVDDMTAAADRNFQPENKTATDFESSEMFQEMNDATTHGYETLEDAQAALDESTVLLDDLIAAGDEAYKYSRGVQAEAAAATQIETPAFKNWFGDSKVVGDDGAPQVMYHGTLSDFTEFSTRNGIYFVSPDSDFAARFTIEEGGETAEGAQIMPVYVSAKRPFDYQNKKDVDAVAMRAGLSSGAIKEIRQGKWSRIEDRTVIESIKQSGFDGVYVNEDGVKNLAVFSPEQIKSAIGNTGSFDPNNPDIRFSQGAGESTPADILTESVRRSFGDATDSMVEAGQITVVNTPEDIPGGPHPGDVKAATAPDGRVYIVAQNVSEAEARGIVLHEVGVHVGMENMVGPQVFGDILNQIDDAILRGESWAVAARNSVPSDTPAGLVREEQLAYLVQNAPEQPLVKRIIGAIRAWAYRTFNAARKRMTLTEADYQAMAVSALRESARVPQTKTPGFRSWFSGSKVVGADGEPLVVFHGTSSDISEFSATRLGENTGAASASYGFFFTNDTDVATSYADLAAFNQSLSGTRSRGGQNVMPVYLNLKNPLEYDAGGLVYNDELYSDIISRAKAEGHDGVIIRNTNDHPEEFDASLSNDVYVAFEPTQIKSAIGNTGAFDPSNSDIRYSRGDTQDPSTIKNELQPYDDAISRAQGYSKVLRAAADKLQSDAQATAAMRAAMPDISPAEINDLLTQLRQRTKGLAGMARTARNSLLSPDVANSLQSDAMKAADELGNNLQMAAVIEKRNAQLNIAARLRIATSMTQYLDSKLDFEGFMAELVGTERRMEGGRLSVDAEQKNFRGQLVGGFIADLEKSGQFQTFVSGKFDRDIYAATWDLSTPGADMSRYTPEVRAVAEVLQKYNTAARNLQNRFGAWIGELPGYVTSQSHDMIKIRHAGVDEFKKTILPLLDLDRTLGENPGDIDSFLTGLYDSLASGVHLKSLSDPAEALAFRGQGAALARKVSQDRVIHFKDGSAAFEYNKKFGAGTLAESVVNGLEKSARTAGLLKKGGTNPRANYERAFDEYAQRLIGADPKRRNKFQTQRKVLNNVMDVLDGTINIPGNAQAAQVFGGIRALQSMSKLGGMLISSITDLASYGAELRFSQGQNLASGTLSGAAAVIRGRSKGEQKSVLNSLGVFHESIIGQTLNRFDNPDLRAGVMSKMMQQFFKLTGQNRWTESLRDSYVLSHSNFLASNAGTSFDKLPAGLGDMLSLYNIDAAKWEALRTGPLTLADGRNYLTPESVASIPRAALENYITGIGRTVSDTAVQNLRDDLSSSLRAMAIDRATHAVVEPNARARAFMTRGTQPGTLAGEIFRLVGQFKSFPVAMTQMILGREIYGRGYNTLGEYVRNGRGDMLGMVTLMATYTALGYAAMSIKDLLKGKNPRPMDDPRTWMAAFIQGGGAGIYGDFLFGKFDRMGGSITATLAGPTFGNLDAAADLWTRMRDGDDSAAAAFRFALNNTPFINLFYTRTAMDYLFLYQIQEAMNPGFLRRMERRAERENAQTYYLPPSQVTR